jgi:hypothetical protein
MEGVTKMNEQLGYAIFIGRHGEQYAIEHSTVLGLILRARQITEYQDWFPTTYATDVDFKEFIDEEEEAETRAVAEDLRGEVTN